VRYADRIAYLTHDALDAMRAGLLRAEDFPPAMRARFGPAGSPWIGGMIEAVIEGSLASGEVRMDEQTLADMTELRDFMFERVYLAPSQRRHHDQAVEVIRRLMDHHLENPADLPASFRETDADRVTQAADYVAGMTDRYALRTHERLFGTPGMDEE
jgi:dGTPase